jgi:transcriptional antiterminator RfaH
MAYTMDFVDGKYWAVVNTHSHKEQLALEHLRRQNFEVYCPKIWKRISHARRFLNVERPLFPGYVFVRVATSGDQWRPVLSTVGVRTLVRFGNQLGLLDDAFIASLRARERDGVVVAPETPYQPGQRVKLVGGPFDGVTATIISSSEKDRLVVLMDLLRNSVRATVSQNGVIPQS